MSNPTFPVTDPVIAYMHRYHILHALCHAEESFSPESLVIELPPSAMGKSCAKRLFEAILPVTPIA